MTIRIEYSPDGGSYTVTSKEECRTEFERDLFVVASWHFKENGGAVVSMGKAYAIREN